MRIKQISVTNFRNISDISFDPSDTINFLSGPNGSGKSSILEAIHLLSSGKSYRTHITTELVKKGTTELIVRADFSGTLAGQHSAGLLKGSNGELQLRLDHQDVKSTAEVARVFPVRTIHPELHELIKGGPSSRRKFIDWGLFHVEHQFHVFWKRFNFALRQRNKLLKNSSVTKGEIEAWGKELSDSGAKINQLRNDYLLQLEKPFQKWVQHFQVSGTVSLSYKKGWDKELDFEDALSSAIKSCMRYRTTTVGPHRADLIILFDGFPAKQVVSRGQQKLLVYALTFAQIELNKEKTTELPVLLCDDPEAELDHKHRNLFLEAIRGFNIQTFVTGNDSGTWLAAGSDKKYQIVNGKLNLLSGSE